MVWFTLGVLSGLSIVISGLLHGIVLMVINFVFLFYAWRAYTASSTSADTQKFAFFKCYKIFRSLLMWFYFITAALAAVGAAVLFAISSTLDEGAAQGVAFILMIVMIAFVSFGVIFYCTQKNIVADLAKLEQQQAHAIYPAF